MKKGELHWDEIGRAIIALILLIILIIIIYMSKDKLLRLISKIGVGI